MWMIITLIFLSLILCVSLYFNFKIGRTVLSVQDAIEDSLDILDQRYDSISKILQTPIYYDSPEIRQVLKDIEVTRDSILYIANELTTNGVELVQSPEEQE
jgi:hypothetical protein